MGGIHHDNETIAAAIIAAKGNLTAAARQLGIHRQAVSHRVNNSDELKLAVKEGLMALADKAQSVIDLTLDRRERNTVYEDGQPVGIELLEEPDKLAADMAKWVEERLNKPNFSPRQEITGADGAPVFIIQIGAEDEDVDP